MRDDKMRLNDEALDAVSGGVDVQTLPRVKRFGGNDAGGEGQPEEIIENTTLQITPGQAGEATVTGRVGCRPL